MGSDLMDDLDRQLLAALRLNAREPASALAKRLKASRATIQNRIARMIARGAIQGFTVRTHTDLEVNRIHAVMCIAIGGERSTQVVRALQGFPEVEKVHTTNGRWDLVAELNTATLAEFSEALDKIRKIEGIASSETSILLATLKT